MLSDRLHCACRPCKPYVDGFSGLGRRCGRLLGVATGSAVGVELLWLAVGCRQATESRGRVWTGASRLHIVRIIHVSGQIALLFRFIQPSSWRSLTPPLLPMAYTSLSPPPQLTEFTTTIYLEAQATAQRHISISPLNQTVLVVASVVTWRRFCRSRSHCRCTSLPHPSASSPV